jgi:hypothetical protein
MPANWGVREENEDMAELGMFCKTFSFFLLLFSCVPACQNSEFEVRFGVGSRWLFDLVQIGLA